MKFLGAREIVLIHDSLPRVDGYRDLHPTNDFVVVHLSSSLGSVRIQTGATFQILQTFEFGPRIFRCCCVCCRFIRISNLSKLAQQLGQLCACPAVYSCLYRHQPLLRPHLPISRMSAKEVRPRVRETDSITIVRPYNHASNRVTIASGSCSGYSSRPSIIE